MNLSAAGTQLPFMLPQAPGLSALRTEALLSRLGTPGLTARTVTARSPRPRPARRAAAPGEGLLSFAHAHWSFSSRGACSFDAARLAAWHSAGLFLGGRARAGAGRFGHARLPGEARSPGPAELAGRARSGLAAEAWEEPPGRVRADGHPAARGRSLPPGNATSRTHPVHQDIDIFYSNLF